MAEVFVSYARKDLAVARPVISALQAQRMDVWWDDEIVPGTTFDRDIEKALGSASCIVVLWSTNAIRSDWVTDEAMEGKRRNILVPAMLEPDLDLPVVFKRIQAAMLANWAQDPVHPEFIKLVNGIGRMLRRRAIQPSPARPPEPKVSESPIPSVVTGRKPAGAGTKPNRGRPAPSHSQPHSDTGRLVLEFRDAVGRSPADRAMVYLEHTRTMAAHRLPDLSTAKSVTVEGLRTGRYLVMVYPRAHLAVTTYAYVREKDVERVQLLLPTDPEKVRQAVFPSYGTLPEDSRRTLEQSSIHGSPTLRGNALYDSLDSLKKATLLNIQARLAETCFHSGRTALSYVSGFTSVRADRLVAVVDSTLREEVEDTLPTGMFRSMSGALRQPPDGFAADGSFKTSEHYATLEMSFFRSSGQPLLAEFSLDDQLGIEHFFRVIRGSTVARAAHPYEMRDLLCAYLRIDPGYELMT